MSNTVEAPQDSVLRRHWQASREIHANSAKHQSTSSNTTSTGGFFSWLKSLFS